MVAVRRVVKVIIESTPCPLKLYEFVPGVRV
jgi:hypothetical protein